jgi:uncharacterized cofD-like protein
VTTEIGPTVAIGGGSGLAVLLRGLKHHVRTGGISGLTAVVTVADDGGSSGRLRRQLGVLPPGDVRSCMVALADDEDLLAKLFQYRFPDGEGLAGHSFGNLFLTALARVTGDFYRAVVEAERILSVRGRILPATLQQVRLRARGASGREYQGESAVGRSGEPLTEVTLEPPEVEAFPAAAAAVREARLILLGPGSLYTSVLPNLLIPGIGAAVRESRARLVMPMNLMTQPGETDGMDAAGHLAVVERHLGRLVDAVVVNAAAPRVPLVARYREEGAAPVLVDEAALEARGVEVLATDLLDDAELIRHDPGKLARAVLAVARERVEPR